VGRAHKLKVAIFLAFSLLAGGAGTTSRADTITTYTINFTTTSGPAPTSGSFTYDSTTPRFTNFLVVWEGITFDLTSSANAPIIAGTGCTGEASTPAYGFALMTLDITGCPITYLWIGEQTPSGDEGFAFVATLPNFAGVDEVVVTLVGPPPPFPGVATGRWAVSTIPEPASFVLLGSGLLALWGALRRRLA
jgi:hypothetical protein